MKTAIELLKEIKDKDIKNKIKTGAFFLSDEQRDNLQQLLKTAPNNEYKSALKVYKEFDEYDTAGELVFSDWLHARLNQQS